MAGYTFSKLIVKMKRYCSMQGLFPARWPQVASRYNRRATHSYTHV